MTATIEQTIEVQVPIATAYNQWTQFEEFPRFMEGVQEVRQMDDRRLHWGAEFGGETQEWDAEIVEQVPEERIAWRNTDGEDNAGIVTFHKLDVGTERASPCRWISCPRGSRRSLAARSVSPIGA